MSSLYASIKGEKGEATCRGHKQIVSHVRGWNIGIRVIATHDQKGGDVFVVYQTGGSNNSCLDKRLITIREGEQSE